MDPITALLIMAVLAGAIAGSFVFLSAILGPKKRTPLKDEPFECGVESDGMARTPVPVKFYLTALLFILFDVEPSLTTHPTVRVGFKPKLVGLEPDCKVTVLSTLW